jgi:hypothetical protein
MRRKVLLLTAFIFCSSIISYGQLSSKVDERFELTSIAARLAGYEEYGQSGIPDYTEDINSWFAPYKSHPLISFLQQVRTTHHIGYDAISSCANAMEIRDGKIKFRSQYDLNNPSDIKFIDQSERWNKKALSRYLKLLNSFYKKSRFADFYNQHTALYADMTEETNDFLRENVNSEWFNPFYGVPFGTPDIYVSLVNWPQNYGLVARGHEGVVIGCVADDNGAAAFNENSLIVIIHELSHIFANPLAFVFAPQMAAAVDAIAGKITQSLE